MAATAAFRAEAARHGSDLFPVVTVEWPAWVGTKHYGVLDYCGAATAVIGGVTQTSSVRSAIAARPTELQSQQFDVTLVDRSRAITRIIKGQVKPRRARVTVRIASRNLAEADWLTRFQGILVDWEYDEGSATWTLHCKTDDRVLLGRIPKPQLTKGAFPGAPNDALGLYLPVVLGIHDSQALSGSGMVPTVCISFDGTTYGYRYAVTIGQARSVPRVYKNGNLQTVAVHYVVGYPVIAGIQLTTIDFLSATAATDVITCDVEGLTVDGTSSGPVILNPADQLRWVLVNLTWGDWRSGAYLSDSTAPIASSTWAAAATYMQAFGDEGAMHLGGDREPARAQEVLNDWLKSEPLVRGFWNSAGELAVRPFSHVPVTYIAGPVIDVYTQALGLPRHSESDAGLVSKVAINHLFDSVGQRFSATLEVEDYFGWVDEQVAETLDMPYSSARFQ